MSSSIENIKSSSVASQQAGCGSAPGVCLAFLWVLRPLDNRRSDGWCFKGQKSRIRQSEQDLSTFSFPLSRCFNVSLYRNPSFTQFPGLIPFRGSFLSTHSVRLCVLLDINSFTPQTSICCSDCSQKTAEHFLRIPLNWCTKGSESSLMQLKASVWKTSKWVVEISDEFQLKGGGGGVTLGPVG